MKRTFVLLATICFFIGYAGAEGPAEAEEMTKTFVVTQADIAGKTTFLTAFQLGGARLVFSRVGDNETAVRATVTYDVSGPVPVFESGNMGTDNASFFADFSSGYNNDSSWKNGQKLQTWDIQVGVFDVATELRITGGGIAADAVNFGGLPLTSLELVLGGALMGIDFSTPTTRRLSDISISCGGTLLTLVNIGNTNFENFSLTGGGNICMLDFGGALDTENHQAVIMAGGSLTSVIGPDNAGAKATVLSVAAPVVASGNRWERETAFPFLVSVYRTGNFDAAAAQLFVNVIMAGSVMVLK